MTIINVNKFTCTTTSILVVDDQPDNFDTLEMLLADDHYHLHYAANGVEALDHLQENDPDLILMDVMMPVMTGIEATQHIKAHSQWQHIPIIMVTALTSKEELAECLESGADDFVSKPINRLELRARIRSMLRIRSQYLALEASLKLRTDLANMLVHDLRSPLASIMLSCDLLQRQGLNQRQLRPADRIAAASRQLQSMIDSLLTMAKLESGKFNLQIEPTDLVPLIQQVAHDYEAISAQKRLHLTCRLPDFVNCFPIDRVVFRRILDNLVSNAVKFSPLAGTITLALSYPTPEEAIIQVMDEGKGVPEAFKQAIFDPYETGEMVRGVVQTGLGLAFCKMSIAAHGGTIEVTDNQPSGAIFTISLASTSRASVSLG